MLMKNTLRRFSSKRGDVRVRFAPSPTGLLHLGGLRTALLNYIFAKKHKGSFLLRIEDTDRNRLVPGAAENLESTLNWMGLFPDESPFVGGGYGSYLQSGRLALYHDAVNKLLDNGSAYKCFCSEDRLMLLRKEALRNREIPKYDGKCRNLPESEVSARIRDGAQFVVRFKHGQDLISFQDLVFGESSHDIFANEGDSVLLKSDKFPTYHMANVVDDYHMQISHVLRGEEWLMSTVKHLQLYRALEWSPPKFGHFPLLTNNKGAKLSKRHGDVFVEQYKDAGYFPLALVNFLTRMGGGFKDREEHTIYSLKELKEKFDLKLLGRNRLKVDFSWLQNYNQKILESLGPENLVPTVQDLVRERLGNSVENLPPELNVLDPKFVKKAIQYALPRLTTLKEILTDSLMFFWAVPANLDGVKEFYEVDQASIIVKDLITVLEDAKNAEKFDLESLKTVFRDFAAERELIFPNFMHFLRYVMSGTTVGPPVGEMFDLLGWDMVNARLWKSSEIIETCL